ncbi:hypothetical protein BGW41_002770 [Actinomortierella wolfii]|nr:hypothetical protein BGW41_002770 [Actinomortierella wolfii]
MLFRASSFTAVAISTLALLGHLSNNPPTVQAHSWLDCVDWKFNNPGVKRWGDKYGECRGYARRYPINKEFGSLDSASPSRHYQQDHIKDPLPCSDRRHGKDKGSDETKADPPEDAYGGKYGRMTETYVGDTLCLRWPAKNHAEDNEDDDMMVQVYLSKVNNGPDPKKQSQLKGYLVDELPYKNCDPGKNADRRACGGCFKVPMRSSGIYLLQWRWELNEGEWYTSCADVKIGNGQKKKRTIRS